MPLDLTRSPASDPLALYRFRDGLYAVDLIAAAITEFDFFTKLAAKPSDLATVCRDLGTHRRPTDVMLTLFAANGFITVKQGIYSITPLGNEHLVSTSSSFLGPYYASLKDRPVVKDFITILRTDKPANWGSYKDEKPWTEAMLTDEFATSFTAAMDCRGFTLGPAMAKAAPIGTRTRLLDIAGGSGVYACALVANHPKLTATVFERPPVDGIARKMIAKRGFQNRVDVAAGDMFKDSLPAGYDVHLFSNVLHDWDTDKVRPLLAASAQALSQGGLLIVHDAHLNDDKTGPAPVAAYSALLMSVTEGRCYGTGEMRELLTEAGFIDVRHQDTACDRSIVTAIKV
ncbi:MAG: methyltransferase [Verrucomicrobia bacterium]|nr:methyltransferase [Verrucomicrobiota bacterium]NBY37508.1 methyltransferase [Verrucomicrobiota bacterium]